MIGKLHVSICHRGKMKFGIDIPGTVKETVSLDEANGNTLWQDEIKTEMKNPCGALKLCDKEEKAPVGHTKITCHIIFYLRLDMTLKAQYVAGGHLTYVPTYMTYYSVVSRDTVCIVFLMADLNNLDVLAGDIQNNFFGALTKENIFFYAGDEWKYDKEKVVIVVRSLYSLKYSALKFQNCLTETLFNRLG